MKATKKIFDAQRSGMDFRARTKPLIGTRIGRAWRGYGSAIFLELGELSDTSSGGRHGKWCIAIEWDWRVESGASVLFGSSNTGAEISDRISELEGTKIDSIEIYGDVKELIVQLSNGFRVRTAVMVAGDPEWSIRLSDGKWLYVVDGVLEEGPEVSSQTPEQKRCFESERMTSQRWGVPCAEPVAGSCSQCASFVRLDAHAYLLDYGVCTAADSELDGKVVKRASGCPQFKARSE